MFCWLLLVCLSCWARSLPSGCRDGSSTGVDIWVVSAEHGRVAEMCLEVGCLYRACLGWVVVVLFILYRSRQSGRWCRGGLTLSLLYFVLAGFMYSMSQGCEIG